MARNPYRRDPRWRRVRMVDLPSWLGAWWQHVAPHSHPGRAALRIRWGARAACRRLRAERDEARKAALADAATRQLAFEAKQSRRELRALEAEAERLRGLINRDRTGLAEALGKVLKDVRGYSWIHNGEWGSYDYTQHTTDTLRTEIGFMLDGIKKIATDALAESGKRAHDAFHGWQTGMKETDDA